MQAPNDRIPDARNMIHMKRTPRMLPMSGPMARPVSSPAYTVAKARPRRSGVTALEDHGQAGHHGRPFSRPLKGAQGDGHVGRDGKEEGILAAP